MQPVTARFAPDGRTQVRPPTGSPVLEIEGLSVSYATRLGDVAAVRDVSLRIAPGETLGVVGESGSGKSTLAFAAMGYLGDAGRIVSGSVRLHGQELVGLPQEALRRLRGSQLAMVYQDPQTALNPALVIGEQVAEAYRVHAPAAGRSGRTSWARTLEMLRRVGLPDPARIATRYPHQLSGGQQQRVVIAMALINDPPLVIMDEPTTGLDVTTEALILDLVAELKRDTGTAILYISHNLGVIAQVCDRVAVMYAGELVEQADVEQVFYHPSHPYTVGLLQCLPRPGLSKDTALLRPIPGRLPAQLEHQPGCIFAPRCDLVTDSCRRVAPPLYATDQPQHRSRCHYWELVPGWAQQIADRPASPATPETRAATPDAAPVPTHRAARGHLPDEVRAATPAPTRTTANPLLEAHGVSRYFGGRDWLGRLRHPFSRDLTGVRAVDGVSFELAAGETLALVGESGCGKTTLARTIAGLDRPTAGTLTFMGQDVTRTADQRPASLRRELQMVFQNPDASLNPRHTVGQILARPLQLFLGLRGESARRRVAELLYSVGLSPSYAHRLPAQLSGGEKQRVSIARAFAGDPRLIICDEAVSALDVSVQATILNLLVKLQRERGTSYLFISHDLGVVQYLADRIGVMYLGKIVEIGRTQDIIRAPQHPYTEALLSAIPVPDPRARRERIRLQGPVPSPTERPAGCPFAGRCPRYLGSLCDDVPPPVQDAGNGHHIACHIPLAELAEAQQGVTINHGAPVATLGETSHGEDGASWQRGTPARIARE